MINLKGINRKNKYHVQYPDVPSAIRPIPYSWDLPDHELDVYMEYRSDSEHSDMTVITGDDAYKPTEDDQPVPLTQSELNDLTRDVHLSKESAQLLGSRHKEKKTFGSWNNVVFVSRLGKRIFTLQDKTLLVYWNSIAGLIKSIDLHYDATEWRHLLTHPAKSLKAVLLLNENSVSSIPIKHSIKMKETHNSMDHLLSADYERELKWLIGWDFKVV